ncbi:DUF6879 family protein [Streptomyces gibsoniae]|uniref:DUF6879 domain-containing protein n=1 Tax=Streptomyces gibsoniae TaxID=3075529 RepID=A0ABU2U7T2_9ACTN|nr:DUF6879 family protein [Streptomyces sp. DSM 41699]MDT0469111.1 hypothetical protein [Streptomyces sp. DSM 41699]
MRQLRFNGTDSKNGGCPAVHEDVATGEIVVQGTPLTDPEDVARLRHFGPDDVAVVVPRELLVNHGPKEMDRVPKVIGLEEFGRLFETFEHTAWRLETRRGYASDREDPTYTEFVETGGITLDYDDEWSRNIRRQVLAYKTVGRVRIIDEPPTEGQLFLLADSPRNTAAGEDIRCLPRSEADARLLGTEDFWIFDSRLVARLNIDEQDVFHDVEIITEPAEVLRYCQIRDRAMHGAFPCTEFTAQLRD